MSESSEVLSPLELVENNTCWILFGTVESNCVAPFDKNGYTIQLSDWLHLCDLVDEFYSIADPEWHERQWLIRDEQRYGEMGLNIEADWESWNYGYVYVLQAGPYFKIGRSKDINRRISQLSTLPPFDLEVLLTIEAKHAPRLEAALHERFADKRKNGEWFELDEEDVAWLRQL